jgi:hypothetical protein
MLCLPYPTCSSSSSSSNDCHLILQVDRVVHHVHGLQSFLHQLVGGFSLILPQRAQHHLKLLPAGQPKHTIADGAGKLPGNSNTPFEKPSHLSAAIHAHHVTCTIRSRWWLSETLSMSSAVSAIHNLHAELGKLTTKSNRSQAITPPSNHSPSKLLSSQTHHKASLYCH